MSDLYEELGLSKDATPEQIRKAYKKKALQTHPDRLPPTATSADKSASEEKFRKVNNAYEVLSDPKKRNEYDIHGIWPPPEAEPIPTPDMRNSNQHRSSRHYYQSRSHTYPDPYSFHRHTPFSAFEFTDPFTLFDSIFEDHNPFRRHRQSPFSIDPFERINRLQTEMDAFMDRGSFNRDPFAMDGFPMFGGFIPPIPSFPAIDRSPIDNSRGRWVSESYMTSTVNGVTQTIRKRVDHNGNEHVTRTLPDGREIRTINGIEQPASGRISYHDPSKDERLHESSNSRYLPPVATHSLPQPLPNTSRTNYSAGRSLLPTLRILQSIDLSPWYILYLTSSSAPPMSPTSQTNKRSRRSSEKYYPTGDTYNPHTQTDTHHREVHQSSSRKKKWWQ